MLGTLAAALLVVAVSVVLGHAALALCGWRSSWVAAATGFALLLVAGGVVEQAPGGAITVAIVLAVLIVASASTRRVRSSCSRGLRDALPLVLFVLLAGSLPFLVNGRAGILGAGNNNDMVQHLTAAYWLGSGDGAPNVLLRDGYPLGPHGIATVLSETTGMSLVHAFNGVSLAILVLTAFTALSVLQRFPYAGRLLVAAAVALCYLSASYFVQGAFKETAEALLLLALVVGLRELVAGRHGGGWPRGIPLGLLAGSTVYVYSLFGVGWPLAAAALALLLQLLVSGLAARDVRGAVGPALLPGLAAALSCALVIGPQIERIADFLGSPLANHPVENRGNLFQPLSPALALGIWLRGDLRFDPEPLWPTVVLLVLAGVAAAAAIAWWLRRRDLGPPAALMAAFVIYSQAVFRKNIYDEAKALVILAPLAALVLGAGLLGWWTMRDRRGALGPAGARVAFARAAIVLVAPLVLAAALASSFLALREGPVNSEAHAEDLAKIRPLLRGKAVLHMDIDDFSHWYLAGVDAGTGPLLYPRRTVAPRPEKARRRGGPFDFDTWTARTLDGFRYVIEPRSAYRSGSPESFRLALRTRFFSLWRRSGATRPRRILEPGGAPGAIAECGSGRGRELSRRGGVAGVLPRPIVKPWEAWRGATRSAGQRAQMTLRLPRGAWDLSLQYTSSTGIDVQAPGMHTSLPPHLGRIGPFWLAGTIVQERSGPATIEVRARRFGWLGRLLGAEGRTFAHDVPGNLPLQALALTRRGVRERKLPLGEICGRYVDWYRLDRQRRGQGRSSPAQRRG